MIKTIVFDIGNVLARFGWKEYLQGCGYEEDTLHRVKRATVESRMWKEWDRGAREEAELIDLCCKQDPGVEKEIRAFFDNVLSMVKEFDYSADLVRQLKGNGYDVYVLSNYGRWHFENDKKHFEFIKYVDGSVISYQINHVKPEAAIYDTLIKKYSINPKEAVFIDDVNENLEGAVPFGFHTILFEDYEQVLEELRMLGIII